MIIQATLAARSQVQAAIAALQRRSDPLADRFLQELKTLLSDRAAIETTAKPFAGLASAAVSEIVCSGYRLFFRTEQETLWLCGVWPEQR